MEFISDDMYANLNTGDKLTMLRMQGATKMIVLGKNVSGKADIQPSESRSLNGAANTFGNMMLGGQIFGNSAVCTLIEGGEIGVKTTSGNTRGAPTVIQNVYVDEKTNIIYVDFYEALRAYELITTNEKTQGNDNMRIEHILPADYSKSKINTVKRFAKCEKTYASVTKKIKVTVYKAVYDANTTSFEQTPFARAGDFIKGEFIIKDSKELVEFDFFKSIMAAMLWTKEVTLNEAVAGKMGCSLYALKENVYVNNKKSVVTAYEVETVFGIRMFHKDIPKKYLPYKGNSIVDNIMALLINKLYVENAAKAKITCYYGQYYLSPETRTSLHEGVDVCTTRGTPVYSLCDGEVLNDCSTNGVHAISIYNKEMDVTFTYMHMDTVYFKSPAKVKQGDKIGLEGDFGAAGAIHVHVESAKGRRAGGYKSANDLDLQAEPIYQYIK